MNAEIDSSDDGLVRLGVIASAFGKQYPTLCALVTLENTDDATRVLADAIPVAEQGLLPKHPLAKKAEG